jgi:hypothetical protein
LKPSRLGRLEPGVGHVVAVADPGHRAPRDRAAVLDEGEDVGQDLAGVVFVGQAVDHRHPRVRGEALDDRLLEGADHHQVAHAEITWRVLDRLAAPELESRVFRCTALPPIWYMPASKRQRVRVLAFSKIIASVRSASGW